MAKRLVGHNWKGIGGKIIKATIETRQAENTIRRHYKCKMKQLYNTSTAAMIRVDGCAAVQAASPADPQSSGLALQKSDYLCFPPYNKLMFQGSSPSQFYLLLQPLQQQCPQVCLQPLFSAPPSIIWTLPLASTLPSVSALYPQETQPPPQQRPTEAPNLAVVTAGVPESEARVVRRGKGRRLRSRQKELQSAKKNSESNIVNQLFSFFNSYQKSECVVERAIARLGKPGCQLQKVKSMFYNIVRLINYRRGRKYVNKENILAYYTPARFLQQIPDITHKLAEVQLLTLDELCFLFRATTAHFLTNISVNAILTSKRITILAKHEHLKRRRKVVHALTKQQ